MGRCGNFFSFGHLGEKEPEVTEQDLAYSVGNYFHYKSSGLSAFLCLY